MPQMGALRQIKNPALSGLRSFTVEGFEDIQIHYIIQDDALRVIRVLHGKRDTRKILDREC